ncbi:FAD-dependent oxidoreductase [Streptomyces sp. NBC_01351]|uniref:FAD-dependent oxidoreductase n=1 Tax=Streptomyces sp. NBC_01351 TaxID=2903833 RepID=UPI003FCC7337
MRSVIVIGGGISGLAAAWQLRGQADVTVLESHGKVGGKLRTGTTAGITVDEGAESFMALRPEAVELAAAVGLGDALCDPAKAPTSPLTGAPPSPVRPAAHLGPRPGPSAPPRAHPAPARTVPPLPGHFQPLRRLRSGGPPGRSLGEGLGRSPWGHLPAVAGGETRLRRAPGSARTRSSNAGGAGFALGGAGQRLGAPGRGHGHSPDRAWAEPGRGSGAARTGVGAPFGSARGRERGRPSRMRACPETPGGSPPPPRSPPPCSRRPPAQTTAGAGRRGTPMGPAPPSR